MTLPKSDSEAVERYIETKRAVLRAVDQLRDELAELQKYMQLGARPRFNKIQSILDGLSSSTR